MAARSIGSATITLGLVAIPVKLFTAHAPEEVRFNRLERKTGGRVKQLTVSATNGRTERCGDGSSIYVDADPDQRGVRLLEGDDIVSGYEYTPDQFVTFTTDELKALEAEGEPDRIRVIDVLPWSTFGATVITKSVFLGPDKGGDRAYQLLAELLSRRDLVASAQRGGRTRDDLFVIAPMPRGDRLGLVMHECLYDNEVRWETIDEVIPADVALTNDELDLGSRLLDALSTPTTPVNTGAARVKAAVDKKVAGEQIVIPPPRPAGVPTNLLSQLRASLAGKTTKGGPKKARTPAPEQPARRSRKA